MGDKKFIEYETEYFYVSKYQEHNKKTYNYNIANYSNAFLGEVKWFAPWRKYCFFPTFETIWDNKCLSEIIKFLDKVNAEHKEKLKKGKTND